MPMAAMPDPPPGFARRNTPVILQHEKAECGLACLAMIAGHFGRAVRMDSLRESFRGAGQGATLPQLIDIAGRQQLVARPLRLTLAELSKLQLPVVLHWRMNHFVVMTKFGRRHVVVHDPAIGRRKVGSAEFNESFTGIALEFTPSKNFSRYREKQKISVIDFMGSIRHIHRYLVLMFCLLFVGQALALVPAVATQILIDEIMLGQDRVWLYRALGGLAVVMLLTIVLDGVRGWVGLYTGTRLATDSTISIVNHLLALPVNFVSRRHLGDLMSKLESLTPVRQAITDHGINALVQFVVLGTTFAIMFLYSPWLTAVSVAGLVASTALLIAVLPRSRQLSEQTLIERAAQNSSLIETLRGYETVRSLGLASVRRAHWQSHFLEATRAEVGQGKLAILRSAGGGLINATEQVAFLAFGMSGILEREITLGVLFAFISLRGRFGNAAISLTDLAHRFSLLRVHTGRLSDIALASPLQKSPPGAVARQVEGSLRARRLSFAYSVESRLIKDFNCHIEPGTHAVVTGPSGCGKTTLLKLLAGQLEAASGDLLVDGIETSLWDREELRKQCATVMQGDQLFQGTITQNIAAFAIVPDLARVRAAAVAAEIWKDIEKLPMRSETLVGDAGTGLSGGQVQRLTLARALYRRPRILYLDEATSQLDVETEKRVLRNIARMNVTVVSVAHRPNAIELANQVISLDG